jgi:hypothetical protein
MMPKLRQPRKLTALRAARCVRQVKLVRCAGAAEARASTHFEYRGRRRLGLTRILRASFPVADLPGDETQVRRRARAGGARNVLPAHLIRSVSSPHFSLRPEPRTAETCGGRHLSDMQHGQRVDEQLAYAVAHGTRAFNAHYGDTRDPCVLNLLVYLRQELRWEPLTCQLNLCVRSLGGFCTAIDLLCTDAATRTHLHVVEVKATRHGEHSQSHYERVTGYGAGALRQLPLSYYAQHQLQLWAMVHGVERDAHVVVDKAVVLRTSPSRVTCYPLNAYFRQQANALERVFKGAAQRAIVRRGRRSRASPR